VASRRSPFVAQRLLSPLKRRSRQRTTGAQRPAGHDPKRPVDARIGDRLRRALQVLARHFEAGEVDDDQAPLRRRYRYLIGRRNQLNYREALADGVPIGSGEIESAHRYIAQLRLKRPGAWWRVEHAEYMPALRINRRNGDWKAYWATFGRSSSLAANQNRQPLLRKVVA